MKKIIHHLRNKPEQTKRHILHVLTISAAVILISLWVYSLGTSLAGGETNNQDAPNPFSALKDNIAPLW